MHEVFLCSVDCFQCQFNGSETGAMVGGPTTCSNWSSRYVRNAGTQFTPAKVADVVKMIKYRRRVTASPKKSTKYMLCPIT